MLPAINLDNQGFPATDEIADVSFDRLLTHKLVPVNLTIANAIPEHGLCVRLFDAQAARDSD